MSPKVSSSPGSIKYTSQESGSERPIMEKQQGTQAKQMEVKKKKKKKEDKTEFHRTRARLIRKINARSRK